MFSRARLQNLGHHTGTQMAKQSASFCDPVKSAEHGAAPLAKGLTAGRAEGSQRTGFLAQVAELVDALASGASGLYGRGSSSLLLGTTYISSSSSEFIACPACPAAQILQILSS